jgi:hypothetical protein
MIDGSRKQAKVVRDVTGGGAINQSDVLLYLPVHNSSYTSKLLSVIKRLL